MISTAKIRYRQLKSGHQIRRISNTRAISRNLTCNFVEMKWNTRVRLYNLHHYWYRFWHLSWIHGIGKPGDQYFKQTEKTICCISAVGFVMWMHNINLQYHDLIFFNNYVVNTAVMLLRSDLYMIYIYQNIWFAVHTTTGNCRVVGTPLLGSYSIRIL